MKIAVVTGASSGLGKEFVKQIARKYKSLDEIWIIARRQQRLMQLKKELKHVRIRILPLDLVEDGVIQYEKLLKKEHPSVRVLVNAAGFGKIAPFVETAVHDHTGMIDLNCKSLVQMTYASIPYMCKRSNIIQIASSAGFMPQPGFSVYAASKAFVLSFSKALNQELRSREIYVTAVCPGPVDTEFFDIALDKYPLKIYKKWMLADPEKVTDKALRDANCKKEVSVYGRLIQLFYIISKVIPHRLIIYFMK